MTVKFFCRISLALLLVLWAVPGSAQPMVEFTNPQQGYTISVPVSSKINQDFPQIRDVFATEALSIEVYFDDLSDQEAGFADYINYGNKFLHQSSRVLVTGEQSTSINGYPVHITSWQRDKLKRVTADKNFYTAAVFRRNAQELVTVLFKSTAPINYEPYLHNFAILPRSSNSTAPQRKFAQSKTVMNPATKQRYQELFAPQAGLTWGIYEPTVGLRFDSLREKIEEPLQYKFKIALIYQSINANVPLYLLEEAKKENRTLELTLSTTFTAGPDALKAGYDSPNATVAFDILDGKYDAWLQQYAAQLKESDYPVLFRLNNEMNGDWCWYSAFYTARDSEIYKKLWIYLHDFMQQRGVTNLIWVWNPHDNAFPNFAWNHAFAYYPGDEYVDVVAMTGYNTGNYFPGETWREFTQIYDPLYAQYSQAFDKLFLLGEFSSSSHGGDKAAWIKAMFQNIGRYPRIKAAIWWNGVDFDAYGNSARIYLINETPAVTEAMRQGLRSYKSEYRPLQSPLEQFRSELKTQLVPTK